MLPSSAVLIDWRLTAIVITIIIIITTVIIICSSALRGGFELVRVLCFGEQSSAARYDEKPDGKLSVSALRLSRPVHALYTDADIL